MVNISEFFSQFSCRQSIKLPKCPRFWLVENQVRLFVAACGSLSRSMLYRNIPSRWRHNASYYTETPCWGSLWWTSIWRPETNKTSVIEFLYERVNQSLEHFIHVKVILILMQGRSHSKIAKYKYVFKASWQLSRPLFKYLVTQRLRNSSLPYRKAKNQFELKICKNVSI